MALCPLCNGTGKVSEGLALLNRCACGMVWSRPVRKCLVCGATIPETLETRGTP